ncbi:MAG: valine--tRNA ligase [Clostridia bacterium]|nr:valine--tRNA ligase [Clostridia bacterium]
MNIIGKTYEPKDFEERIYRRWMEKRYFEAHNDSEKTPFTIVMPPPNITGVLHMGHGMDNTLQDIIVRYKRMQGFETLWVPGIDHASIATEAKIVEQMRKEGITKEDLGREKFLERAWAWKEKYGGTILQQLKKMGVSCDWSRVSFTMDENLTRAVKKVFVDLYDKGVIYKGKRMINWCPKCLTSISDAEVDYEEEAGHLWHIRYATPDGKDEIIVATTRPETMLGDTAVAVHPDDERYKHLVGKTVVLPIMNKEIPIVADTYVEKEFGTGAVKITPAHDPNDFEVGLRHNLEVIEVFTDDAHMNDLVPKYEGMDRLTARKAIVEDLEKLGVLVKTEDYSHNVGKCYRCHDTVEPKLSEQWFVKMKGLAEPANKAVRNGDMQFIPERFDKIYFSWMDNVKDWCISRQLWWGHRIPAYYCDNCGKMTVSGDEITTCPHCGSTVHQDEDTLDTWFSSALWPFATLGWPEETADFKKFFPTDVLVTGYDIIFFWVARMLFSSIEHTGKPPFKHVLIHGLVRDELGRKMSKSLGNGVDPLEVIDKYGADSFRYALVQGTAPGNDMRYLPEKIEAGRNFANKLWNASRFAMMNFGETEFTHDSSKMCIEDKWILNKANTAVKEITDCMEKYEFGIAIQKIMELIRDEICDWYIEMIKPRLYDMTNETRDEALYTLNEVLRISLKMLHPFMPFITEEIYMNLKHDDESIMISEWPKYEVSREFKQEEIDIEIIKEIIKNVRNVRANMNVAPSKKASMIFVTENPSVIEEGRDFISKLAYAESITTQKDKTGIPENSVSIAAPGMEIYIPFAELVDIAEEIKRLEKEQLTYQNEINRVDRMLANEGFIAKAPASKIEEEKAKKVKYEELLQKTTKQIEKLRK